MRVLALVAMSALLLSGCSAVGDFETVPAPEWEAGYSYSYDIEGTIKVDGFFEMNGDRNEIPPENVEIPRTPMLAYQVLGTDVAVDGEPVYAAGALLTGIQIDLMEDDPSIIDAAGLTVRQRDLFMDFAIDTIEDCVGCMSNLTEGLYLDFPLTPGKSWRIVDEMDGVRTTIDSQAVDEDTLNLLDAPLRTIRVVHEVRFSLTPEGQQEINEEMGGSASLTGGGTIVTWYSPEVQNVVRETYDLTMRVSGSGSEQGMDYSFRLNMDSDLEVLMTGADLSPMPERDAAAILAYIANEGPLNDPSGTIAAPLGDHTLVITQDKQSVNAFDAESAVFTIAAEGEFPEDAELRIRHILPDGSAAIVGEGVLGDLGVAFETPGIHQIVAQSYVNDVMQSRASATIVADYIGTLTTACPPAAAMSACNALELPVGGGASSIDILAHMNRQAPVMAPGDLVVMDSYGNSAEARGSNARIVDPSLVADGSTWTMEFSPDVAVLDQVVYEISIEYPRTGAVSTPAEPAEPVWLGLGAIDLPPQLQQKLDAILG